ncbi:MAG: NUDIX hydrolase [Candidatus Bathyarchaeota archaeon]|nr:NUDIX hydrolase [Candidatus Bathyarchaeota archaeon]
MCHFVKLPFVVYIFSVQSPLISLRYVYNSNGSDQTLKKWKTTDSKLSCQTEFVSVYNDTVVLPTGKQIVFTKIELKDFVSVLPIEGDKVVMIEILRYPRNEVSLEIPSGHIEKGETPEEAAVRELAEETGYTAKNFVKMFSYHPLSRSTQTAHLFVAKDLAQGTQMLEENEQINVKLVEVNKLSALLASNKIVHAPTLLALQQFLLTKQS